jgi:hypothetical protein
VIYGLEKRIMELKSLPGVATNLKNTDIYELDTVIQVSRIIESTQPEDGDNRLDA